MKTIKRVLVVALAVMIGAAFSFSAEIAPVSAAAEKPVNMVLNASSVAMVKGQKMDLFLYDRNAADIDELGDSIVDTGLTWRSSNKKVASVKAGYVLKAKKAGKATISTVYKGRTYKCKVRVYKSLSKKKREKLAKKQAKRIVKTFTKPSMPKAEKAFRLAEYLYQNTAIQNNQSNSAYKKNYGNEAYAALNMHIAACSGYCKAYMMLCKEAGIKCKHINANKWTHQWNKVKIGGKWYKVDTQAGIIGIPVSAAVKNNAPMQCLDHGHLYIVYQKYGQYGYQ